MFAALLTLLIVAGYGAALWWLLRRESAETLLGIAFLCTVSLSLRLVYTTDYPAGLNEDEPKILWCASWTLQHGGLFQEGCTMIPVLLNALFQAQLVPVIGPNRWAMRAYSLATSVLSVAAAFAVARSLGVSAASGLAAGAFIAVLPWSIFFGRIALGGELLFHELLLLAALARLVRGTGEGPEVAIGSFGLSLLLYDYFCGRVMLGMPLGAAVLARGRRARLWCVAITALALLAWVPHLLTHPANAVSGEVVTHLHPGYFHDPLHTWWSRTVQAAESLVWPIGLNGWFAIQAAAMHPLLILALAVVGVLAGIRRGLFLAGGFLLGLLPSVLSDSPSPSVHRIEMALPFVALAAAVALDQIRWRRVRAVIASAMVLVAGVQSVRLYFSPPFWPLRSRNIFDWERTALVEALPPAPHPPFIVMNQLGYFFGPLAVVDHNYRLLVADDWLPDSRGGLYAFTSEAAPLLPFYDSLLGPQAVQRFGRAFLVRFGAGDWSWLRRHGWTYEARCGAAVRRGWVPTLFHPLLTFNNLTCNGPVTHVWRGRWQGPARRLVLEFSGHATIDTPRGRLADRTAPRGWAYFSIDPGAEVTITITTEPPDLRPWAALSEMTPDGMRLPDWESVAPVQEQPGAPIVPGCAAPQPSTPPAAHG